VWQAIERAIEFSMYLIQPDGRTPAIGDADDGKPIRFEHRPLWDFRAFQAIGAVIFNRADFKHVAGGFHEDALWLLGTAGREQFERIRSDLPADSSRAFRDSGYYVLRSGWSQTADYVCFDCGEQGAGARHDNVPDALHGHADCLAVSAFLGGEPLFVDSGFLCYNGPDEWQNHFRKTAAHNTARIDGRDQSRHLGKMAWSDTPRFRQEYWVVDAAGSRVTGWHDGYARGSRGVVHRRTVWLRPAGYLVIYDEFVGKGDHALELVFQMPPATAATLDAGTLLMADRFRVAWQASTLLVPSVAEGGEQPEQGWVAPSLGVRVAAPRLALSGSLSAPRTGILTICADLTHIRQLSRLRAKASGPRLLTAMVITADAEDIIVAIEGDEVSVTGLETDARMVISSDPGSGAPILAAVGDSYLRMQPGAFLPTLAAE
jgi:hypothetical protein